MKRQAKELLQRITHRTAQAESKRQRDYQWNRLLLVPIWVFVAFIAAQYLVVGVVWLLGAMGSNLEAEVSSSVGRAVLSTAVYVVALALTFGVPFLVKRRTVSAELLGLTRLPSWTDIGLSPLAYVVYILVASLVIQAITQAVPGFQPDQVQDVGFSMIGQRYELLAAFITIVIIAPIAEEVLFRGYLYGKLLQRVPVWAAMLATSVLFGIVHMQWNVGVDVFVLSMFLCALRSLTGSIWAGVLVHMIKNGIAFFIGFVAPLLPMVGMVL